MTPKQKAIDLMSIFNHSAFGEDWKPFVKRCAMSCVDEVINVLNDPDLYLEAIGDINDIDFWNDVKKEIEKQ